MRNVCGKATVDVTFRLLRDALGKLDEGLERVRDGGQLADQKLDVLIRLLELVNRYQSTAEALEECSSVFQTLQLNRYMGDYAL